MGHSGYFLRRSRPMARFRRQACSIKRTSRIYRHRHGIATLNRQSSDSKLSKSIIAGALSALHDAWAISAWHDIGDLTIMRFRLIPQKAEASPKSMWASLPAMKCRLTSLAVSPLIHKAKPANIIKIIVTALSLKIFSSLAWGIARATPNAIYLHPGWPVRRRPLYSVGQTS